MHRYYAEREQLTEGLKAESNSGAYKLSVAFPPSTQTRSVTRCGTPAQWKLKILLFWEKRHDSKVQG